MENKIVELYKNAGYTPEQVVSELCLILGCAILSSGNKSTEYKSKLMNVSVKVEEL